MKYKSIICSALLLAACSQSPEEVSAKAELAKNRSDFYAREATVIARTCISNQLVSANTKSQLSRLGYEPFLGGVRKLGEDTVTQVFFGGPVPNISCRIATAEKKTGLIVLSAVLKEMRRLGFETTDDEIFVRGDVTYRVYGTSAGAGASRVYISPL